MPTKHFQLINLIANEPDFKGFGLKRATMVVEAFEDDIYDRLDSCDAGKIFADPFLTACSQFDLRLADAPREG